MPEKEKAMMHKFILLNSVVRFLGYDGTSTGWKKDADGKLALDGAGNPIWLDAAGTETSVANYGETVQSIGKLNREAKGHRERAEKAEADLKVFEGLDPAAARTALETVSKLDMKKLIDAGEVERVRADIAKNYDVKLTAAETARLAAESRLNNVVLDHAFSTSKYIADKIAVPADMLRSTFGSRFKSVDGKLLALNEDGTTLISRVNPAENAPFDEALGMIVEAYPMKDRILKGNQNSGTGNNGNGGNNNNKATHRRADFDTYTPAKQAEVAAAVRTGTAVLVD